jgi:hypothetical protein
MEDKTNTKTLACSMTDMCTEPVSHIDDKGFAYCARHGIQRRSHRRCRKLKSYELTRLKTVGSIARY